MSNIKILEKFDFTTNVDCGKDKEVREIFNGARRRLIEIKLCNRAVLTKHRAAEPITIFCLKGNGTFSAGANLEDKQILEAGVLLTLEGGIEHEVAAEPELHILLTKFKED